MRLAIISHTEHFKDTEGNIVGWGPTVREINYLANNFEHVFHVACFHNTSAPPSATAYTAKNVEFVALPPFGGKSVYEKLSVLTTAPQIIKIVSEVIDKVDAVQLRMPTGMGNYLLPYLSFYKPNIALWVKYAGNWADKNAPLGYKFQKWWLKKNFLHCPVTINGKWSHQPAHCQSFENPCIEELEQVVGMDLVTNKKYNIPLTGIFVGRLEEWKGVDRIIQSISILYNKGIKTFHFVGGGDKLDYYSELVQRMGSPMKIIFHDYLKRDDISRLFIQSHIILLPSDSEGFPKVIAEAANYGCVPIVSNISSIPHYINDGNGFLWDMNDLSFGEYISNLDFSEHNLKAKAQNVFEMSKLFSFKKYNASILKLLKDKLNKF